MMTAPSLRSSKGNRLTLEILDDPGGVLAGEIGKQRRHLRCGGAHDDETKEADQRRGDGDHRHHARCAQSLEETCQTLQRTSPVRFGSRMRVTPTGQNLPRDGFDIVNFG
jgi:hypothetical protein